MLGAGEGGEWIVHSVCGIGVRGRGAGHVATGRGDVTCIGTSCLGRGRAGFVGALAEACNVRKRRKSCGWRCRSTVRTVSVAMHFYVSFASRGGDRSAARTSAHYTRSGMRMTPLRRYRVGCGAGCSPKVGAEIMRRRNSFVSTALPRCVTGERFTHSVRLHLQTSCTALWRAREREEGWGVRVHHHKVSCDDRAQQERNAWIVDVICCKTHGLMEWTGYLDAADVAPPFQPAAHIHAAMLPCFNADAHRSLYLQTNRCRWLRGLWGFVHPINGMLHCSHSPP